MNETLDISVIIPVFNEQDSLPELHRRLTAVLQEMNRSYEIVFVNDGSTDDSDEVLVELAKNDVQVRYIEFQKNFGKSAALSAGFKYSSGQFVVTMDSDLQDDPNEIPNLLAKLEEGYDLVSGWKKKRNDPWTKRLPSKVYNYFTSIFSGIRLHDFNCGLKAYRTAVVKTMSVYGEMHRYLPVIAHQNGFKVTEIPVTHHPRQFGESKFGAARFTRGAFDLMTITFLTRYKKRPLHFFGSWGMTSTFIGFIILLILAIQKIVYQEHLSNRPLLFLGVLLVIVGVQFISIGLIGEMITETRKDTDPYLIRTRLGWEGDRRV